MFRKHLVILLLLLAFLMVACGQTEVIPTTTTQSTAAAESVQESTTAVEETPAPEVHTGEHKTVYIANEEAYWEYIANNNMPEGFISYDDLSCFGKLYSFTAPLGWEFVGLTEYRYEFVDENGYSISLKIEQGRSLSSADNQEISVPRNGDMRKPVQEKGVVTLGELRYVYNSGKLLYIFWFDGKTMFRIAGNSKLSEYPESDDTVIGKLLNSNTAEAVWKEIAAVTAKNMRFLPDDPQNSWYDECTPEEKAKLDEINDGYELGPQAYHRQVMQILGDLDADTPRVTLEQAIAIAKELDEDPALLGSIRKEDEFLCRLDLIHGAPDCRYGSGAIVNEYYLNDSGTERIIVFLGHISHYEDGTETEIFAFR